MIDIYYIFSRILLFIALLVGTYLIAKPSNSYTTQRRHSFTKVQDRLVKMLDMKYSPDFITVVVGQRITWSNDSKVAHTVTSGKYNKAPQGKEFNSFWIMPGKSWSWIPTKPGIYEYFCMPHAIMGMTGTIVVIE